MKRDPTLADFSAACDYPGTLNMALVESSLREYLDVLGEQRQVVRLPSGWMLRDHPSLVRSVDLILTDIQSRTGYKPDALAARAARDARAALAARDARAALDARDAEQAFAAWCVQGGGWWWRWELSWISTTWFGANQNKKEAVTKWAKPILDAFLAGAWILYWTDDTLYWVSKPTVHTEKTAQGKRLHNEKYAALESDVENLYFLHGVLVPAFVVVRPDWITVKHIETEDNAEVRRVMIERFGQARYLLESGSMCIHADDFGTLYRKDIPGDEPLVMVKVVNSTPETDGSFKDYFIRVDPNMTRAKQAVAWTFDKTEYEYQPACQT